MNKPTYYKVRSDKKPRGAGSLHTCLSFPSGFGRSRRLWVLGQIIYNQSPEKEQNLPVCDDQELFGIVDRPSILFSLALTFLNLGSQSILGRAKAFLGILWYPLIRRRVNRLSN